MEKKSNLCVKIPWTGQKDFWWNQTCADIMEVFGLPGGRYITEANTECLAYYFQNEKDYLMCQVLVSDKI